MKKLLRTIAAALLMLALCTSATAQTSPSSTPASGSPAAASSAPASEKEQLVAILIARLKAEREVAAAQRAHIAALEEQLKAEQAKGASLAASYQLARGEIAQLRTSLSYLERAIKLHEESVQILKDQNAGLKAQVKKSRKQTAAAAAAAIIMGVLRFVL